MCAQVTGLPWKIQSFEALLLILLIPYNLVRHLKYIAPFSSAANLLMMLGFIVILQYCCQHLQPVPHFPAFGSSTGLALFFGQAIYAFEGIAVVSITLASVVVTGVVTSNNMS